MIADYSQSELLYWAIDSFETDEPIETNKNKEWQLPIFIALKTLCDTWSS